MRILFLAAIIALSTTAVLAQQPQKPTASEIYHKLEKLNFLGSALYVAAHPDDENTRLISYLANDMHAKTAYLSLTRGDGGQNLIGPEIRELLGVIRTQELLAARASDGGEQLFTRANDFGYSKHPDETLEIWNKDAVLSDVVRAIRTFKPDVIINRFNHRNPGSTHGHHTASAMLSFEAFDLVGDATKFPETAITYGSWQPKRLLFNTSWWFYGSKEKFKKADKSNLVSLETGNYYPALGLSNGEIASLSRSMHKSQGFGSTGTRGKQTEYLEFLKGEFPQDTTNIFDGINTSWSRIDGGVAIGKILNPLLDSFNFQDPSTIVPQLVEAYRLLKDTKQGHWRSIKLKELEELIVACSGVFLEAVANKESINPMGAYTLKVEAINRGANKITLSKITTASGLILSSKEIVLLSNEKENLELEVTSQNKVPSTAYWLKSKGTLGMYSAPKDLIGLPQTPAAEQISFTLNIDNTALQILKDVVYKFNDPVDGEVYRPFNVLPKVSASIAEKVLVFANENSQKVAVHVRAGKDNLEGTLQLNTPKGWVVSSPQLFTLERQGETSTLWFTVTPPKNQSQGYLRPLIQIGDTYYDKELINIDYDHIPYQSVLLPSKAKVVRINIEKKGQHIGYIQGAGDGVGQSLEQIGYSVTNLDVTEISAQSLKKYDAVVVGVRAYNTIAALAFAQRELNKYVQAGGTMVVQYNTSHRLVTKQVAPYALSLSRDRVTDEFAPVTILDPSHSVLNSPNKITQEDFKGWVQERGLYFPNKWAEEFTPILAMNDKGAPQTKGSLLVARYGKGHYVYTGLSFFRELPAGVAGAYRLFANIISIGK
ncbi:PIG-L family deacetylase [Flavobacteriaceae bacterium]|nr:PIG-L family deacetylase [Flavobacteriaceae bacterium]